MAQAYAEETGHDRDEPGPVRSRVRRLIGSRGRCLVNGWRGRDVWRRGLVVAGFAVLLALLMILHAQVPNDVGNLGSLLETFLPWIGMVTIPVLLACALFRRSASALVALLLPVIVWLNLFGGLLTSKSGSGGDLTVVTHNVNADNSNPAGTARDVAASGAHVVALEELTADALPTYERALKSAYPYHTVKGTVGLWSAYPIKDARAVDIKMGWTRALRATVAAPKGEVAVYVPHLPSVRVKFNAGFTAGQRDDSAEALGKAISHERLDKVLLLGDLNGTMNDRALAPVTSQLRSAQGAAGDGFGFSWPVSFPMARIDQILVRGVEPVSAWTLPETGSDHLPVAASVNL